MSAAPRPSTLTPLERARRRPAASTRGVPVAALDVARERDADTAPRTRRLRADDWPAVLALADRLLGFPFDRLIRCTRDPQGWVLEDAGGRLLLVQLTRVVTLGRERLGVMGWTLAEPRARRPAPGRAIQAFFDRVHDALRAAGCGRLVVGDSDAYRSPSWRLAHAGGYRRWTPLQQLRVLGWRWPASFWRLPHFGVRTFVLQRPLHEASTPLARAGRGTAAACTAALFVGGVLFPLTQAGLLRGRAPWTAWSDAGWVACLFATLVHVGARASAQVIAARRRGLAVGFRAWDSGLVTAALLAPLGVFVPAFAGAPYVRDERYDYLADRGDFGGVRAAGVLTSLALTTLALALHAADVGDAASLAAVVGFGLWSGLTDTLPLGGPWSALAVGAVRRARPRLARGCFAAWCALLVAAALVLG